LSRRRASAALGVLLLVAVDARPQGEEVASEPVLRGQPWDAITMFHGMPSRNVRAIAQDGDGFLWFGTDAGLVRYDGQRVERVALDRSHGEVLALAAGSDGRLWVGTEHGAYVRSASGVQEVALTTAQPISAILIAPDGRVRLASRRGRIFSCSGDARRVEVLGPETASLLRRADGSELELASLGLRGASVVVGSRGRGLLALDGAALSEIKDPLRPFFVNAIAAAGSGLTFGADTNATGRGLFTLEGDRVRPLDVRTGPVTAVAYDANGGVWAGTRERGLVHLGAGRALEEFTLESTGGGLHSNRVHAVLVDRDGVVWVGTDRGVCRYDPSAPRTVRLGDSPDANFVQALYASADGRLWAGTQRGLFVRSEPSGAWTLESALARSAVHAIGSTAEGNLLVGHAGGLRVRLADAAQGWQPVRAIDAADDERASVRAIQTYRGAVYLATFGRGLERLDEGGRSLVWPAAVATAPPASESTVPEDSALREVVSLGVVGDALWIGTARAGTFVLAGDRVARDEKLAALGTFRCAAPDGQGGTWLGGSEGLFRLAAGNVLAVVEGEDVRAVVPQYDGRLSVWCATARSALLGVALTSDLGVLRSRVDAEYGMPSESVFSLLSTGSRLVLGTNRGLVEYDPGRRAPGLRIVKVLGRRPYAPDEWSALRLEYPQNGLLVEAAAVGSRTYPERFQYAFSLEDGAGRAVSRTLSRDGQFAAESLRPGRYRVSARAFGANLVASSPVTLDFEVAAAPIPWPAIALAALLFFALLALAWGGAQYTRLRTANAALRQTRLQLVHEAENERRRIARDLHDQTLADLRGLLIALPASGPAPAGVRDDVEAISSEVRRICEDLSPSVLENVGLPAALEWALDETLRRRPENAPLGGSFTCGDDLAERLSLEPAAEIQIYRIVQEALANAARHSGARELRLSVELSSEGTLAVTLEDDGGGFDPTMARQGLGLSSIRSRASLIGAQVEWLPRDGAGTRFVLRTRRE
jgi:signal transduction histidine kinase